MAAGAVVLIVGLLAIGTATPGGPLPGPLPLFPADNWWNVDVSSAPVDPASAAYIAFINDGSVRSLHPDFGGEVSPGSVQIYGLPYVVVDGLVPKQTVSFLYGDESDGVDHETGLSYPFYPIPDEAITQPHWIEGGEPGNVDLRASADRHLLIVDGDNRHLYELYNVFHDGGGWLAGSGAVFDLDASDRRPDGWTSADAAGLAILPGLVRYDEVFGAGEIEHAFRVTVRATNGYVYPASHQAGSTPGALPMGARLRLKPGVDISGYAPEIQRIFTAMKHYGLIVADNGSDLFVSGTFDTRWDNDVLNPAFASITADDFEVVELSYRPPFTDDPLVPGVTVVRAVHFYELRARIDALRGGYGLMPFSWTDDSLVAGVTPIKAIHVTELRTALSEAYAAAAQPAPAYTDPGVGSGTPIKALHVAELRGFVTALE